MPSLSFSNFRGQTVRSGFCPHGFGLIELLVTISIMLLVTTVVLARHSAFNSAILLRNQAYSLAFAVRDAQQQAVSIVGQSGDFTQVYGLHVTEGSGTFRLFRDADNDDYFDTGEMIGAPGVLDARFQVSDIRVINPDSTPTALSVSFVRPNFDARFDTGGAVINAERVEIDVALTGSTARRTVVITRTGQVSVETPP
jgi:prepilin-type N-terminal cleavage/methylation domain-containing protein